MALLWSSQAHNCGFFLCGAPNQKKTALLGREREIKHSFFLNMCNLQSCSSEILELEIRARTAF